MNLTNSIAIGIEEQLEDKLEAFDYFKNLYPGIKYIEQTDSYQYRGFEFDYFKAGISMLGLKNGSSYMLVWKPNSRIWLFTYGDLEDRWTRFMTERDEYFAQPKLKKWKEESVGEWFRRVIGF